MTDPKKRKSNFLGHIASAIIPSVGIIAVPSAFSIFPQQKIRSDNDWGSLSSTLLRAASESQLFISSSSNLANEVQRVRENSPRRNESRQTSDDDDEDDDDEEESDETNRQASKQRSNAEQKFLSTTRREDAENSENNPKKALAEEVQRLSSKNESRNISIGSFGRNISPLVLDPVLSATGPSSARTVLKNDNIGIDGRATVTPRSSLNASTTIPMSARSVAFKDPLVDEVFDLSSSKTFPTASMTIAQQNSALERIVLPPPEEYQQNFNALERQNSLLNTELGVLRTTNQNLQKQYEQLLERIQTSQNLSKQELNDLLQQSGYNKTRDLENLNNTLQNRCEQLEVDLRIARERSIQNQNSLQVQGLKTENAFLKDSIHRLNAALSEYQTQNPPKSLEKDIREAQRQIKSLPSQGPTPSWLLNRKFLVPLLLFYDEKIRNQKNFIKNIQNEIEHLKNEMKTLAEENLDLHRRLSSTTGSMSREVDGLSDLNQIKRQAYLVLKENEILQKQIDLETNQLAELQRSQIQEVSNLNRRLLLVENEKSESDRILETLRIRNEDLRRKYENLMLENNHRIHVQQHFEELNELKRLTDEMSEKHAAEMQQLLRRIQENEATKKLAQLKLTDCRAEVEQFKAELKVLRKTNKKLQLRVETFEKKVQLEQIKKENINNQLETTNGQFQQTKLERDTFFNLVAERENELKKVQNHYQQDQEKLFQLEESLKKLQNKSRNQIEENFQKENRKHQDNFELRAAEYEQRIQQLMSLLNEKDATIHDLNAEKRILQNDLETIWQSSVAENMRKRENFLQFHSSNNNL